MAAPLANSDWLSWIGKLAGDARLFLEDAELPPETFHCRLEDLPSHLIPGSGNCALPAESLRLNPSCLFLSDGALPTALAGRGSLVKGFARQGRMVWVQHSQHELPLPFWLGRKLGSLLGSWREGDAPELSPGAAAVLCAAGVLSPTGWDSVQTSPAEQRADHCRIQFQQSGYSPIAGLIHPFHVAALRRYYRYQLRSGSLPFGDDQSPRRYVTHNESVARFYHHLLTPVVSSIAGELVKPSYVYFASYQAGATLEKHTDREQCEFSISFCLDYSPEPGPYTPWPLRLHPDGRTVTVFQGIGDALVYRGRHLPHSRGVLPSGHSSTSIFFHYVREGFTGSLD